MSRHERGERRVNPATQNRREKESERVQVSDAGRAELVEKTSTSVRAVMRCFVDDDIAQGVTGEFHCPACAQEKPNAGAINYVVYGTAKGKSPNFCNDCSTDFEISRLSRADVSPLEFLQQRIEDQSIPH